MFSFLDPKVVFSTVVERKTEQLFRMTQIEKVAVRIAWFGGDKFIAIVGNEKLDALLVADYYGLDLRELAQRYNDNQQKPLIYTETQAVNQHLITAKQKEVEPSISGLTQMA